MNNFRQRPGCGRWVVRGVVFVVIVFLFWNELKLLYYLLRGLPSLVMGQPVDGLPPIENLLPQLLFLGFIIVGFILFSYLVVMLIARSVLPVRTTVEHWEAIKRFYGYLFGRRDALLMIREGKIIDEFSDRKKLSGGVALVDLNSAVVLERHMITGRGAAGRGESMGQPSRFPMARLGKPGLVFIRRSERLRGVLSLRKQFRINLNIMGQTSDGIEVKTHVFSLFTLGQPATIIKVAYCGDTVPDNLRVLQIDGETKKIRSISDELDRADKAEIHHFAQSFLYYGEPSAPLEPAEKGRETPPFHLDEQRIFAAAYAQARSVNESDVDSWSDLPAQVATEVFRNKITQVTYDSLYLPDDPSRFPLQTDFKPRFARHVRYLGVMSYQFVHRLDGQPPVEGQRVDNRMFRISTVQDLHNSKVLRDRGIKIIHAGFTELVPTDPKVRQQRLDNWRARWQQEADMIRAELDLEAMRIKNRARADKQHDLITNLSRILQSSAYSEEALALRVFQALEDVATDPNTRQLLPSDTVNMLRSLRLWLLPDEQVRPALLEERREAGQEEG